MYNISNMVQNNDYVFIMKKMSYSINSGPNRLTSI